VFEHGRRASQLLIGVELSDGRRASNLGGRNVGEDPSGHVFHAAGGGGGQLSVDQSWWLSPVPTEGPVRFVCRCAP